MLYVASYEAFTFNDDGKSKLSYEKAIREQALKAFPKKHNKLTTDVFRLYRKLFVMTWAYLYLQYFFLQTSPFSAVLIAMEIRSAVRTEAAADLPLSLAAAAANEPSFSLSLPVTSLETKKQKRSHYQSQSQRHWLIKRPLQLFRKVKRVFRTLPAFSGSPNVFK